MNAVPLSCISMKNQKCKIRPQILSVNGSDPVFSPFSIKPNKCSGNCKNMNNPYVKLCVLDVVKNLNVKVFKLMSRTNETRHIKCHETCKCKCRLDESVCNNKQCWNDDKCRCKCKELIDKGVCDKGSIWNTSNCECECYKSSDFSEYLDYRNYKCKKKLADKLVERSSAEECTENVDEVKITRMASLEHEDECVCSYTICVVLAVIVLTFSIGIGTYFVYFRWYLKKMLPVIKGWVLKRVLIIKQQSIEP